MNPSLGTVIKSPDVLAPDDYTSQTKRPESEALVRLLTTLTDIQADISQVAVSDDALGDNEQLVSLICQYMLGSPDRVSRLDLCADLVDALWKNWIDQEDKVALLASTEIMPEVIDLCPLDHHSRATWCANLVEALCTRFNQTGEINLVDESIRYGREGLAFASSGIPGRPWLCHVLATSLSLRYQQTLDFTILQEALALEEEALKLWLAHDERRNDSCINAIFLLIRMFDYTGNTATLDKAIGMGRRALALLPSDSLYRVGLCANVATALTVHFKRAKEGSTLLEIIQLERDALSLLPKGSIHRAVMCRTLADSITDYYNEFDGEISTLDEVYELLQEALRATPRGHPKRWRSLRQMADIALLQKDHARAIETLNEALQEPTHEAHDLCSWSVDSLGRIDVSIISDKEKTLLVRAHAAVLEIVVLRTGFALDHAAHLGKLNVNSALGPAAFSLANATGQPLVGLELLERARGVIWSQALHVRNPQIDRVPVELRKELQDVLGSMSPDMTQGGMGQGFLAGRDVLYEQRSRLRQVLHHIRLHPGLEDFMRGASGQSLLACATRNRVVVLVVHKEECHALIIASPSAPLVDLKLDVEATTLQELWSAESGMHNRGAAAGTRLGMHKTKQGSPVNGRLAKLWRAVVKPIIAHLGLPKAQGRSRPRIHWCPTGAFAFIPIHAAGVYEGSTQECCSDYVVSSYTPTLAALVRAQQDAEVHRTVDTKILIVAAEYALDKPLPPLRGVPQEVRGITEVVSHAKIPATAVERTASKAAALAALPGVQVVHFACHGIQQRAAPHKSHFCLADGDLTVAELMQVDLDGAFFAFLSACETGRGDLQRADEAVHLAAAMLFAGFKSVVATMWPMADEDGPFIAKRFYDQLFAAEIFDADTAAYAFDHAVTALRRSGAPPERWSAFVHMGA